LPCVHFTVANYVNCTLSNTQEVAWPLISHEINTLQNTSHI